MRRILVTSALPYANGSLHLGHLLEHIQTDIWARAMRLMGHDCIAVCADDAHGTPIMLKAKTLGLLPEAMIAEVQQEHQQDFVAFDIDYQHYHSTHSPENQALANAIYQALCDRGDIEKKTIDQLFDPETEMFLPDRFIKGQCPKCGAEDQYGDSCEQCGATYAPTELVAPRSVLSGAEPVLKQSEHCFFKLPHYEALLRRWTTQDHLQPEVTNKLAEWFEQGLKDWDISRDAPYFGFEIPDEPGKYFYVWLDAPIGYMASFKVFCEANPDYVFEDYWGKEASTELYHFIGKDIIYFHALFWPALCSGAGFRTPTGVFAHGFVTMDGQKMSKSRGTLITARRYCTHLPVDALRYYFACKLNPHIEDIDIQWDDFLQKVNADLVGKVVNIASRCAKFIHMRFDDRLSASLHQPELVATFAEAADSIAACYEQRAFAKAIRQIMQLADRANQYVDQHKPWQLAKQPDTGPLVHGICSTGLNLFRIIMIYLKPVLPSLAAASERFLQTTPWQWQDAQQPLCDHPITEFKPLMGRIEQKQIDAMLADTD